MVITLKFKTKENKIIPRIKLNRNIYTLNAQDKSR